MSSQTSLDQWSIETEVKEILIQTLNQRTSSCLPRTYLFWTLDSRRHERWRNSALKLTSTDQSTLHVNMIQKISHPRWMLKIVKKQLWIKRSKHLLIMSLNELKKHFKVTSWSMCFKMILNALGTRMKKELQNLS